MLNINRKSIVTKFSATMIIIIFLQSIFFIGNVLLSGVISNLRNSAFSAFNEKLLNRKNYLENEMNARWSNIDTYAIEISKIYNSFGQKTTEMDEKDTIHFLEKATPYITAMLRSSMTTGAFVILDDNKNGNLSHSCVYIKDYDPILNTEYNEDLYMIKGPVEISRSMQIPMEKSWSYGIELDENNKDIFYKPYNATEPDVDARLFGYWQVSPHIGGNGINMLTYSMPLIDKDGNAFGVIGIEVTQEYLFKVLPKNELFENSSLGYMIAKYDSKSNELIPVLMQGSLQKAIATQGIPVELMEKNKKYNSYEIINSNTNFSVLCNLEKINVYNSNTPFEDEQWILIGLVEEEMLLGFSNGVTQMLFMTFLISIIAGTITVFIIGIKFTKPIINLSREVRKNNLNTVVALKRTGLFEIDELSFAIETLNKNILDEALKTDKIIGMVSLPIGTFEYKKGSDFVKLSPILFDMLKIDNDNSYDNTVNSNVFFRKIDCIKNNIEDLEDNIYWLEGDTSRWVKIVSFENENNVLGVIMDVSKDVLNRHTMIFERDYDPLTKIFNRYAFVREAKKIFERGIHGQAAFAMFDLDNLKYINDTHGHDYGDIYIKSAAAVISDTLCKRTVVGRMSGDEFYVFLYDYEDKDEIRNNLKLLYKQFDVRKLLLPNGNEFKIKMSGGVAWYGHDSNNFEELIRFADFAMYQGKHSIKGEVREFNKTVYESESFLLSGREELNRVLDNQLIEFAFQPIISAKTGDIYAYESLMRPQSDVLNTPTKLIQIATSQSRLWQIEKITFFKTLSTYVKYDEYFKGCKLFINSVPNEILKEDEYAEIESLYCDILDRVVIEIIENEKLEKSTLDFKKELVKKWGGVIALDDYGSGYNGDISLLSISPKIVKVDRVMIEGIENDRNRQSIVQKLLLYAKERDIIVLGEGVETKEQMDYLVKMGVDLLQGYYIGKPSFIPDFDNSKISSEIKSLNR